MFRFFRHARDAALSEHRFGRYARYALGEIVLVVVGILIALQINNWNEQRIEQREMAEYAVNLAGDIQRDLDMLAPVANQINTALDQANAFRKYALQRPLQDFDNAEVLVMTTRLYYRPFAWNRAALDQLKNSGGLRLISNQVLVDRISAYDALSHHLDQDYANDVNRINQVSALVNQLVDLNYPETEEFNEYLDSFPDEANANTFRMGQESEIFQRMQARKLPLLTPEDARMHQLANQMLELSQSLEPRPGNEIPRLRRLGEEIIAIVQAEYGQSR